MDINYYIDNIVLELTGGVLELEIPDSTIEKIVNKALKEMQRYTNETKLMTIPFSKCIDLSDSDVSVVTNIYRVKGMQSTSSTDISDVDPMYAQQWTIFSNGSSMYNLNDWLLNYSAYNTLLQIQNTTSTDLAFEFDKSTDKLYINVTDKPTSITIKYIPTYKTVDDVKSDYWQDILYKLSLALTKIALGRIRTRFTTSNQLWEMDGATMLEEGTNELKDLREQLIGNSQITYLVD